MAFGCEECGLTFDTLDEEFDHFYKVIEEEEGEF